MLETNSMLILDGGLATELERRGADLTHPLWSARLLVEDPKLIRAVHEDYVRAGADIITTASYQLTPSSCERAGRLDFEKLLTESFNQAQAAREIFPKKKILIAGSVGPYGAFLCDGSEYTGSYSLTETKILDFHRERLQSLAKNVDMIAFETFPSFKEIQVASFIAEELKIPYWISVTLRSAHEMSDGTHIANLFQELMTRKYLIATGVNCIPPKLCTDFFRLATKLTALPLILYPNSGERYDPSDRCWVGFAEEFRSESQKWWTAQTRIIGGCCRTNPDDIRFLKSTLSPTEARVS